MAERKKASAGDVPTRLVEPAARVRDMLLARISKGRELDTRALNSPDDLKVTRDEYYTWREYNLTLLRRVFTTEEVQQEYRGFPFASMGGQSFLQEVREFKETLSRNIRTLSSIVERLDLYDAPSPAEASEPTIRDSKDQSGGKSRIFLIHGHDEAAKHEVARFLGALGLDPVVLSEQPSRSQTVIEKFEANSEVDYAIALMTPDDIGGTVASGERTETRARQNVVFELGYFLGKLGRDRTCILHKGDTGIPSDLAGIVYVDLDLKGAWKLEIARNMKAAGLPVDLNKAFS